MSDGFVQSRLGKKTAQARDVLAAHLDRNPQKTANATAWQPTWAVLHRFRNRLTSRADTPPLDDLSSKDAVAPTSKRSDLAYALVIALLGSIAVYLRWRGLGSQSLWLDEGYTYWISRFSPKVIWRVLAVDSTTPLYYDLVHYWSLRFGTSEFWLRSLSAIFGTLSIPLYYLLARKILADRVAIIFAMAAFALNFFQVWYAQEARSYALLVFLSFASVYCLLLYLENRELLPFCGVVASLTASLYTHNIVFFYLPGFAFLWLVYPARRDLQGRIKDGLLAGLAVFVLYLPWLPTLRAQLLRQGTQGNFWLPVPGIRSLLDTICISTGLDTTALQLIFRSFFSSARLFGFWTWSPAILGVVSVCILGGLSASRVADRRKAAATAVYCLSPMLLAFAYSHVSTPLYTPRLFVASSALLPVALSTAIAFHTGKRRRMFELLGCATLLGLTASTVGYWKHEQKEDWRGAAAYVTTVPQTRRLTVVVPDTAQPLVDYYASELPRSGPAMDVTGLLTKYDPPDEDLERRTVEKSDKQNTDALTLVSEQMAAERYEEIDLIMQPNSQQQLVKPLMDYLARQCSSMEIKEFHWLEVRRCSLPTGSKR
jgi:4-amino-4-deoxy-L-arabinose transferase-like glycosyltransferase